MKKTIITILILAVAGILLYTIYGSASADEARESRYMEEVLLERRDKDSFMRNDEQSPLKPEQKESFTGLKYFEPDPAYRIEARVEENKKKDLLVLPTSDNKQKPFKKWGYAVFTLDGEEHRLLLLQSAQGLKTEGLFLPFADATSANETYGAGRYLDLKMPENKKITIDFNKAYNPYCAYTDGFSCPFPPKENQLGVAIPAGEKSFQNYD